MSKANNLSDLLKSVADAIRLKKGTSALIDPQNFETEIASIPSGGTSKLPQVVDRSVTSITAEDLGNITSIGIHAFYECTNLATVTTPNSVTTIGGSSFYGCTSLINVVLSPLLTSIDVSAFYGCSSLQSINLPDGLTTIGASSFRNCSSLSSITLPNTLTTIGGSSFYGCTCEIIWGDNPTIQSLGASAFYKYMGTSLTIPSTVSSIGSNCFAEGTNLNSITVLSVNPPTLANVNAFNNTNNCPIYVPSGSVTAYQTASNWSALASRIQAIPT